MKSRCRRRIGTFLPLLFTVGVLLVPNQARGDGSKYSSAVWKIDGVHVNYYGDDAMFFSSGVEADYMKGRLLHHALLNFTWAGRGHRSSQKGGVAELGSGFRLGQGDSSEPDGGFADVRVRLHYATYDQVGGDDNKRTGHNRDALAMAGFRYIYTLRGDLGLIDERDLSLYAYAVGGRKDREDVERDVYPDGTVEEPGQIATDEGMAYGFLAGAEITVALIVFKIDMGMYDGSLMMNVMGGVGVTY